MPEINPNTRSSSTRFVHVGCKLPNGLVLELFDERTMAPPPNSVWTPAMHRPPILRGRHVLKGANSIKNDFTLRGLAQEQFNYAVTPVPEEFWREWYARHKDDAPCARGFVFALPKEKETIAEGKVRASEPTGLEPLKPECEREPRFQNATRTVGAQDVEVDHEHLRKLQTANGRD